MSWKMKEARLVRTDSKGFLKVVFEKEEDKVEPKESVAVNVNMSEVLWERSTSITLKFQLVCRRFRRPRTGRRSP
jgi:hypothetical protein